MAYQETTFEYRGEPVTLKQWFNDTEYATGFQEYYVTRYYVAWRGRKVIAREINRLINQFEVKQLVQRHLDNVMTTSVEVKSQRGTRLYLPKIDTAAQNTVLEYQRELGITPQSVLIDPADLRNVDNHWQKAEYQRKLSKAKQELDRHGHPSIITFSVGGDVYEVHSNADGMKVVKQRARQVPLPKN